MDKLFTKVFLLTAFCFTICLVFYSKAQVKEIVDVLSVENNDIAQIYNHYPKGTPEYNACCFLLQNIAYKYSLVAPECVQPYLEVKDSVFNNAIKCLPAFKRDSLLAKRGNDLTPSIVIRDYQIINGDSIIKSIKASFEIWRQTPWANKYDETHFFEYVLPYRIMTEPLEYYWKWDCFRVYDHGIKYNNDIIRAARIINDRVGLIVPEDDESNFVNSYSFILKNKIQTCAERAVMATMAMRAGGIPAAFEFIPVWGNRSSGHYQCSVILPDDSIITFHYIIDVGTNVFLKNNKVPKVYRRMFSTQYDSLLIKNIDKEYIPPLFSNFDIMDVTDKYPIGSSELNVKVPETEKNNIVYLSVFSSSGWTPVAYTENNGENTKFYKIGTGNLKNNDKMEVGENVGDGILYLPITYDINRKIRAVNNPMIHGVSVTYAIIMDSTIRENVILTRKYPKTNRILSFAREMRGGIIEGANNEDFSDAVTLYYISYTPLSHLQKIHINSDKEYRYLRYRKQNENFSLSEIRFANKNGDYMSGELISCKEFRDNPNINLVIDGNPLTYFSETKVRNAWIGIKFERPTSIGTIEICPRTDDNDISIGDQYELFFWNKQQWQSLGVKIASDYNLSYNNVPKGALLWLRDITKGKEERPFTYENGLQIWW